MDAATVFGWAQSYFEFGDFTNARKWYAKRVEMGGSDEEAFLAKYRLAVSMHKLGEHWPEVQDAYLRAWAQRPSRAEPLHAIASRYRGAKQYHLGYLFARRAAGTLRTNRDRLAVDEEVYTWRAVDELAVCAAWTGRQTEAFTLSRKLIALHDLPEEARQRVAKNRDFAVPTMRAAAAAYPAALIDGISGGNRDAEVTVSLVAGPDRAEVERTLNSFLNCCRDLRLVGRFLVLDTGLSAADRQSLRDRYRFVEVIEADWTSPADVQLRGLRAQVGGRFWLHLGRGWEFFAAEDLITRLTAVLEAEPQVFQVGINFGDATKLTGTCAAENAVRRAPGTGRYAAANGMSLGPAMLHTARLDRAAEVTAAAPNLGNELGRAGLRIATLDEVLCTAQV